MGLVALRARQAIHVEALQDPPGPRGTDIEVVVALLMHGDLLRPEVVFRAQIDDLADHLGPHLFHEVT